MLEDFLYEICISRPSRDRPFILPNIAYFGEMFHALVPRCSRPLLFLFDKLTLNLERQRVFKLIGDVVLLLLNQINLCCVFFINLHFIGVVELPVGGDFAVLVFSRNVVHTVALFVLFDIGGLVWAR